MDMLCCGDDVKWPGFGAFAICTGYWIGGATTPTMTVLVSGLRGPMEIAKVTMFKALSKRVRSQSSQFVNNLNALPLQMDSRTCPTL